MKKIFFLIIAAAAFAAAGCGLQNREPVAVQVDLSGRDIAASAASSTEEAQFAEKNDPAAQSVSASSTESEPTEVFVPPSVKLKVPFASQAPLANWDALHQEACEEASIIMAARYFLGQPLDAAIMEEEILKLVQWEKDNGYGVDLDAADATKILDDYFSVKATTETEATADRIKYELSRGHLVIAPFAGRLLGNPYYRQPGPIYHMLVITGYSGNEFITNDVGTKRGEGYRYRTETIINAIHNWSYDLAKDGMTDEEMAAGGKIIIVVFGK